MTSISIMDSKNNPFPMSNHPLLKLTTKPMRPSIGLSKTTKKKPFRKQLKTCKKLKKSRSSGTNLLKWRKSIIFKIRQSLKKSDAEDLAVCTKSRPDTQDCTEPRKESRNLNLTNLNSKSFSKKWSSWCLSTTPISLNFMKFMTTNLITCLFFNFLKEGSFLRK